MSEKLFQTNEFEGIPLDQKPKRIRAARPRIVIDVSETTYGTISNTLPWGVQGQTLTAIMDELAEALAKHGVQVGYLIAAKKLTLFGGLSTALKELIKES